MYPKDEMNTWSLCALVFIHRLKRKKWQSLTQMNRIALTVRKMTHLHEIVAAEMELGEKLPHGFEPLDGEVIEVQTREVVDWNSHTQKGKYGLEHNPKPEVSHFHRICNAFPRNPNRRISSRPSVLTKKHTIASSSLVESPP
jgi:hypothetical protein